MLEQRAASRANRRPFASRVEAEDFGTPGGRVDESEQHANGRRLPGPVRPEKPEQDALGNLEREGIEGPDGPEIARNLLGTNGERAAVRHGSASALLVPQH